MGFQVKTNDLWLHIEIETNVKLIHINVWSKYRMIFDLENEFQHPPIDPS